MGKFSDKGTGALTPQGRSGIGRYKEEDVNKFPYEAFEAEKENDAVRTLTLIDSWDFEIADNLVVGGDTTLGGTLGVTGAATFSDNAEVGGTLDVTGATTLDSTLDAGATTLDSLEVTGESDLGLSHVRVGKTSSQTVQNTPEKITWDASPVYDALSDWDNSNHRFVAPGDGYYLVSAHIMSDNYAQTTGDRMLIDIYKNGSQDIRICHKEVENGITAYWNLNGASTIYLETDDYIELWWQGVGLGAMTIGAGADANIVYFTIDRLVT